MNKNQVITNQHNANVCRKIIQSFMCESLSITFVGHLVASSLLGFFFSPLTIKEAFNFIMIMTSSSSTHKHI